MAKVWSETEKQIIKDFYNQETINELKSLLPNRTWRAIGRQANLLKVKYTRQDQKSYICKTNTEKLLEETPEAYYWIGFLLADGCFYKTPFGTSGLRLGLANQDFDHLVKFCKFINSQPKKNKTTCNTITSDKINIPKIQAKFDIQYNKTYYPPNFDLYNDTTNDLFLCLLIGFIDGDGHIRKKDSVVSINLHTNWINFLNRVNEKLNLIYNTQNKACKIYFNKKNKNRKFLRYIIHHRPILRSLKRKIIQYDLPALNRKWCHINDQTMSKSEKLEEKYKQLIQKYNLFMKNNNATHQSFIQQEKISDGTLQRLLKWNQKQQNEVDDHVPNYAN